MRTIARAALALGFVGAMAIGTTAPVTAQGFNLNGPGLNVHIGPRERDYRPERDDQSERRDDRHGRYYDYSGGNGCPPHYTIQDGVCKPYRGY